MLRDIERWKRELREVELADDGQGTLPYGFRLVALKGILIGKIVDHVRMQEARLQNLIKETGEIKNKKMYEEIEKDVYSYIRLDKLEKQERRNDAMDTNNVNKEGEGENQNQLTGA